jgi:hypothetical protein
VQKREHVFVLGTVTDPTIDHQAAITPETVFLVWTKPKLNLTLVREFLEQIGQDTGILASNNNCIPMVNYFNHNMKEFVMSLILANVFELLYPDSPWLPR